MAKVLAKSLKSTSGLAPDVVISANGFQALSNIKEEGEIVETEEELGSEKEEKEDTRTCKDDVRDEGGERKGLEGASRSTQNHRTKEGNCRKSVVNT